MIGIPTGIFTALYRDRLPDYIGHILSLLGLFILAFYLGILLMIAFAVRLCWFPVMGRGKLSDFTDNLKHLVLPALSLGIIMTAYIIRMTHSSVLNILREDYARTARAKRLAERVVVYTHALKNALIPIVSVIGVYSTALIGDSVMTEIMFSRPGLGKLMVGP